jgi:type I restriction enzyme R subunit
MPETPEDRARKTIDDLLDKAGWVVQDRDKANVSAARGVAVRSFPLKSGHGFADYLLYVDGQAAGVIEAKKEGETLIGFEIQTAKYSEGLPDGLKAHRRPLPFCYQSTGVETRFTNLLDPDARSRQVFAFHRPETFAKWLEDDTRSPGSILRARLRAMPPLIEDGLRKIQIKAIHKLEESLAANRPRALIQMASGSGKTFTACNFSYRLIKHAGARRILFLVDRNTLGGQTLSEFHNFTTPEERRKFVELYNVQHMQSNKLDDVSKVCITTIQRLYSMLKGEPEFDPGNEEGSMFSGGTATLGGAFKEPIPVSYNPALPIETFDFIVTDECHRSIYHLWRQVLEYFDAFIIGLTATPSKQTFGFFNQNLVTEYGHEQAVADGVNVDFDVYRIRTQITGLGSKVDSGFYIDKRDRQTRKVRWEQLDDDFTYAAAQLDREVVAPDQIRTVIRAFQDKVLTEIFPGRTWVPKTLIFAKDDSHAEDIVNIVREEFAKGNDFCHKITYKTNMVRVVTKKTGSDGKEIEEITYRSGGQDPEVLLNSFRNSPYPRIVVTVDKIATGTDVRPLEIVFFMRSVASRNFFEQMKGRGARVVSDTDLLAVTPDALSKTHFVIVDAVGACERELSETQPLEKKRTVSFEKLIEAVGFGNREPDVLSSLASRLARLEHRLTKEDHEAVQELNGGNPLGTITAAIVNALDPDVQLEAARQIAADAARVDAIAVGAGLKPAPTEPTEPAPEPTPEMVAKAGEKLLDDAAKLLAGNPDLRRKLVEIKKSYEQTIDTVSQDVLLEAGYSGQAKERAQSVVQSFEAFIREHKDEITALQILYSRPYQQRLTFKEVKELAQAIARPPHGWTPELLWRAYETLDKSKVRGSGQRVLTDIVSLVRYALHQDGELRPFGDQVRERFARWMTQQQVGAGSKPARTFTPEQVQWLELIRDHVGASLAIELDDFDYVPFAQHGGIGKAYQVFGNNLKPLLDELNQALAA